MTKAVDRDSVSLLDLSALLSTWHCIDKRNRQLGWMRYDPADLDDSPFLDALRFPPVRRIARNAVRAADLVAPFPVHSLFQVQPTVVPTAFYHVGMAYLMREGISVPDYAWDGEAADAVCNEALGRRIAAEHNCWAHPYRHHAKNWRRETLCSAPASCAHHTARLGILLLEVGRAHDSSDLISAGVSAARALIEYHQWHEYDDGTATVSYYPNTDDETINTCAEIAALLSLVPAEHELPNRQDRLVGIVRMMLKEQRADGSWTYYTARHYQRHGNAPWVDNHHSAQVLQALARVYASGLLPDSIKRQVVTAVRRGIEYYCDAFIKPDGSATYFPYGKAQGGTVRIGKRPTEITGYTEGLAAIAWSLRSGAVHRDELLGARLLRDARRLLLSSFRFVNNRTYDVASSERFGMFYNIKSLRWGSGPLMEGIQYALRISHCLNPALEVPSMET